NHIQLKGAITVPAIATHQARWMETQIVSGGISPRGFLSGTQIRYPPGIRAVRICELLTWLYLGGSFVVSRREPWWWAALCISQSKLCAVSDIPIPVFLPP